MKIETTPLVSSVSGRAGGIVFSRWKGRKLVRLFAQPSNPNSTRQQLVRGYFKGLNAGWKNANTDSYLWRAVWWDIAKAEAYLGRNEFLGFNLRRLLAGTPPTTTESLPLLPGGDAIEAPTVTVQDDGNGKLKVTAALSTDLPQLPGFKPWVLAVGLPSAVAEQSLSALGAGQADASTGKTWDVVLSRVASGSGVVGGAMVVWFPTDGTRSDFRAELRRGGAAFGAQS